MNSFIPELIIVGKTALAMLLGALIGIDREAARKPAGLRTNMLVAGSAALLVSLSDTLVNTFFAAHGDSVIRADPIRVIEAIITGISFLGAGTIIRHNATDHVKGLTTAASLIFAAAIGIGAALSQWVLVVGITLLDLIVLRLVRFLERKINA